MKRAKLQIKDLKRTDAVIPLGAEQMRFIAGGLPTQGGTTSDTADTDQ